MMADGARTRQSFWTASAVLVVVVVGAWLRLHDLAAMEFKGDEKEALTLGLGLLAAHPWWSPQSWPTHGMLSSNGIANAPLFTWLVAAAWTATRHPVGVTRLIALINAACLYPLWLWARRRMDETRALVLLALCAVSPFAVIFSRKIWTQNLLLPGVLAVLWGVEWLRRGHVWRGVALLGVATLLLGQLHQSGAIAMAVLPVALGVQFVADRRRGRPFHFGRPSTREAFALAVVIALNLFFWVPYLEYFLRLPSDAFAHRPTADLWPWLLQRVDAQVIPVDLFYFFDPDRNDFLGNRLRATCYYGSVGLGAPLLLYGLWRWLRSPLSVPVVGVWWWCVILVFTVARIPCYPFYVLTLAPLPAALAAGAFDGSIRPAWLARGLVTWRIAYVAAMLGLTVSVQTWLAARGGAAGDYGVSYAVREAQATSVLDQRGPGRARHFYDRGEARPGLPLALECHGPPDELTWIINWRSGSSETTARPFTLCDNWVELNGRLAYRWILHD